MTPQSLTENISRLKAKLETATDPQARQRYELHLNEAEAALARLTAKAPPSAAPKP